MKFTFGMSRPKDYSYILKMSTNYIKNHLNQIETVIS